MFSISIGSHTLVAFKKDLAELVLKSLSLRKTQGDSVVVTISNEPHDLTKAEAERLAGFVRMLAIES